MRDILFLKDLAYSAKTGGGTIANASELNLLADGAIAILKDDGTLQACSGTITVDTLQFAVGLADVISTPALTHRIPRKNITLANKVTFRPAINPIVFIGSDNNTAELNTGSFIQDVEYLCTAAVGAMTLGAGTILEDTNGTQYTAGAFTPVLNHKYKVIAQGAAATWGSANTFMPTAYDKTLHIGTLTAGEYATVKLVEQRQGSQAGKQYSYSYVIRTSDTITDVINTLVSKINADAFCPITATTVLNAGIAVGIKLVADSNFDFSAYGQGLLMYADVIQDGKGASLAYTEGLGEGGLLAAFEDKFSVHRGNEKATKMFENTWSKIASAVTATDYNVYAIVWRQDTNDPIGVDMGTVNHVLYICAPSTVSTFPVANFDAFINAIKE